MKIILGIIAVVEFALLAGGAFFYYKKVVRLRAEEKERVSRIINMAVQMINGYFLILDEEDRVVSCSDSLVQIIKAESKESLQGMPDEELIKKFIDRDIIWKIDNEIKEKKSMDRVYKFAHGEDWSRWMDVKSQKIMVNGRYNGTIIFCSDISQEMKGKEELLSLVHLKEELLMSISHELKTPLNAIAGSVDMLGLSKQLGENEERHVKNIKEAYRTLVHRVDEITEYSNIKKDKVTVEKREFVLQEIFDTIRNTVYIRTYEKGISFRISVSPEIPARLYGDVDKISSVLLHLLLKGAERTQEGCVSLTIEPVWREDKLLLYYEVSDTAERMNEEEIQSILKSSDFKEADGRIEEAFSVGITIGREYIRALGGELKAESTYDKGNRFWFELETDVVVSQPAAKLKNPEEKSVIVCTDAPEKLSHCKEMLKTLRVSKCEEYRDTKQLTESAFSHIIIDGSFEKATEILKMELPYLCKKILILEASRKVIDGLPEADIILYEPLHVFMLAGVLNQAEDRKRQKQLEEALLFKTKGIRALVVDDNETNVMVCSNILKQYGIETDEADSGIIAVQKYYTNDYDLIMMDYMMPGMDGLETTKQIRGIQKRSAEPVIVVLSANVTPDICRRFKAGGAQETLAKPLELKELSRVLRRWLPKDKIIENEEEQRGQEKELSEETLHTVLQDIEELNIEAGMEHVLNSTESYLKVLKICCGNVAEQIARIKAGYRILAAEDLKINFHSLKGIFANVGAENLTETSRELELAAGKNDHEYLQKHVPAYIRAVEAFDDKLEKALNLYQDILSATTKSSDIYKPMKPEEYKEQVSRAKEAVRQYEFTEITSILEELLIASQGREKDILKKALEEIGEFRYDAVMELLEEL